MITKEQTDARIEEIRANEHITDDVKQNLIDEALTREADQLTHGNNIAIVQAAVFGMILLLIILAL